MNNSYLYSVKNTVLSSKPSKAIRLLLVAFLLLAQTVAFAQSYTITGNVNSSTLTCATFAGKTIVYIGDGVIDSKLIMNNNLDLTTCGLGAIQLIIRNKGILEFPDKTNNILNLPTGSSIVIESGGKISTNGSCSNADLIQIGGNSVSSCQGGNMPTFDEVVENGGINEAGILSGNQYICSIGGNTTFTSSESGGTFSSGSPSVATVNSSGVITAVAVGQSVITYTKNSKSTTRIVYVGSSFGGTVSGGTTVCSTTNSTILTLSGYKGTIVRWESSTNNFSNSTTISNTTNTLTVSNLAYTTSYRAVIQGTGCTANSTSATIIVGTNLSAGVSIAASPTGAICADTSVTFTATPTNGGTTPTYQWKLNGTNVGTNANTYTNAALSNNDIVTCVMTSNATPCLTGSSATSNTVTMVVNNSNTWTGATNTSWFTPSNWSCGSVPTALSDVSIPNVTNKPLVNDSSKIALANTLIVESGSSLIVNSGNTLKVTNAVNNNGGTITFEDTASLVQINDVTNSGNITYKRIAPSVRNTDYTYWSSPVSPLKLAGVGGISYSPAPLAGSIFYSYLVTASSENWKSETAATSMFPGLGYSIRAAGKISTNPPSFLEASFTGVPNNGPYSVAIAQSGASYLLGNPYPSAIDADSFILANTGAIDGTLYFWTHNTPIAIGTPDPGTGVYAYSGNDYATYTLSGGVGTAGNLTAPEWVDANNNKIVDTGEWTDTNGNNIVDAVEWVDANNNKVVDSGEWTDSNGDNILNLEVEQVSNRPTGKIAAGQGFFTTSTTTGSLVTFTNAMRIDGSGNPLNNSNFYKTKNSKTKTATAFEKHRVWLNLSNTEGAFKQTLVGYITGATNTWDKLYDGVSFDGNDFLDFYSINEEKNLTIQGRALPFDENDEIPLGYRIAVEGNFTINIDETDGLLSRQEVFLEDKLTNKTVNLKEGNYTFNTAAGTFDDRFVLKYTNKTLSIDETDKEDGILVLYSNNYKSLIIHNNDLYSTVNSVALFNITGQNIANWEVNDFEQTNIQFPIKNISSGVYIVKVKTTKGESSKKIIIK